MSRFFVTKIALAGLAVLLAPTATAENNLSPTPARGFADPPKLLAVPEPSIPPRFYTIGCFDSGEIDNGTFFPSFMKIRYSSGKMTPEVCYKVCVSDFGRDADTVFGLFDGGHCICQGDLTIHDFKYQGAGKTEQCTQPCWGDKDLICGGRQAMSVYGIGQAWEPPYERIGCKNGATNKSIMNNASVILNNMTPRVCFEECSIEFGTTTAFGLNRGTTCICQEDFDKNLLMLGDSLSCSSNCTEYITVEVMCGGAGDEMSVFSVN